MSDKDEEGTGYGRPPKKSRFQKGQSGNPKGRPKNVRNFATVITEELNSHVTVTENGKRKRISKRQAIGKQVVNRAAGGCLKSASIILSEARAIDGEGGTQRVPPTLAPEDKAVMASIVKRVLLMVADPESSDAAGTPKGPVPQIDGHQRGEAGDAPAA